MQTEFKSKWSTDDYNAMSWHDNHVHGIRIIEGENGDGELVLDLDYILECLPPIDKHLRFRVAPATLIFHQVSATSLRIVLDYAKPTAAISPFTLHGIEREIHVYPNGYETCKWHLKINWPDGSIDFIAPGFTQVLYCDPVESEAQGLSPSQRPVSGP